MAKTKLCPACGESFECASPQRGCWCEWVALDRRALIALRERYSDCLCTNCLKKHASAPLREVS